jgi:hypothetical protein
MKKIQVESNKTYSNGFNLTESDLRRMVEIGNEQLQKTNAGLLSSKYTLKYKNGVTEETKDIEEVLSLENSGSTKISELEIELKTSQQTATSRVPKDTQKIVIEFNSLQSKRYSYKDSVRLFVTGETRYWVFITTSIMEERINKIKIFPVFQLNLRNSLFYFLYAFIFIILLGFLNSFSHGITYDNTSRIQALDSLKDSYHQRDNVNIIDVIIDLQKKQLVTDPSNKVLNNIFKPLVKTIIYGFASIIVLLLFYLGLKQLFPIYIFNWGDYIDKYKKIKSIRNIVFIVFIVGIIVSIIGGLIANKIGKISSP